MKRRYRVWIALTAGILGLVLPVTASAQDAEVSDDRARVSFVRSVIDDEGQLWLKLGFYTPWDDKPPRDLFSFFSFLDVTVDGETSSIGWQVHDGEENAIYDGAASEDPQVYITEDGCMLVATGLFPSASSSITVNAAWGSWVDESSTQAIFGGDELPVDIGDSVTGDPFEVFGQPVFDLSSGEMIMPSTTTTNTTAPAPPEPSSTTTTNTTAPAPPEPSSTTTTSSTVATSTATTGVVAIAEGGDPWFLWSLFILLFLGFLAWLMIFFLQWWVPPFMGPWVRRYGRTVTGGLDTPSDEEGEERKTIPDEDTETGGTDTTGTGTETTGTETTGTDEPETTRDTREGSGTGTGPDPAPGREPTKPDCTPLRVECERLRAEATRLQLEANDARTQADQAADDCEQADTRLANLEAKIADLNAREDAPQRYQRLAEAQIELRAAQATFEAVCAVAGTMETAAAAAEAAAASATTAADAACRAAEECEATGG